jgi:hypothetical protein
MAVITVFCHSSQIEMALDVGTVDEEETGFDY